MYPEEEPIDGILYFLVQDISDDLSMFLEERAHQLQDLFEEAYDAYRQSGIGLARLYELRGRINELKMILDAIA